MTLERKALAILLSIIGGLLVTIVCLVVIPINTRVQSLTRDNITYLVVPGTGIVNYTSDSLEHVFMQPQAEPGGTDSITSSNFPFVLIRTGDSSYTWLSKDELKTNIWIIKRYQLP